jgi:hypothetical protein
MGGKTAVNEEEKRLAASYLRSMRTNDDIWIPERDAWGVDRLAWEEDEDGAPLDDDERAEPVPDDPRY